MPTMKRLREFLDGHSSSESIKDRDAAVKALQREGRRVPFKIHIWYADVWDKEWHFFTKRAARGHQDLWVWVSNRNWRV